MENFDLLNDYDLPITKIPVDRGYWLVRTNSGDYFDDFHLGNYIGIGWNEFNNKADFAQSSKEATRQKIEESIDDVQSWRIFSQIQRFFYGIKVGDIVMIPNKNSKYIIFGEVLSDVYFEEINHDNLEEGECPFEKRRKIKWIKTVNRSALDPYLYKMMQSHFSISDANDYADAIDRTLHGFYVKGDKAHLILDVNQKDDIALIDLISALDAPLIAVDVINEISDNEIEFSKRDLDAKMRVQSPGIIEIVSSGETMALAIAVGFMLVAAVGGSVSFSRKKAEGIEHSASLQTDGIFEKIMKWKEQSHRQNLVNNAMTGDDKSFERFMKLKDTVITAQETLELTLPQELTGVNQNESSNENEAKEIDEEQIPK